MKLVANTLVPLLAIGMVLILALTLRVECARDELWIDEYLTGWTVAESFSEATERARISNQSLPYTFLMCGFTKVLGHSPVSIRVPSFLCGCAIVGLVAALAWQLTNSRTVLVLAAFLAAIDQNFIFYATEARPYVIVQMLGLISCWSLVEWLMPKSGTGTSTNCFGGSKSINNHGGCDRETAVWLIGVWATSAVLMFYSHYTSLFALAAQCLVGSVLCFRNKIKRRTWLVAMPLVAMTCIPGLISLSQIYDRAVDWQGFSSIAAIWSSLGVGWWPYICPFLLTVLAVLGAQEWKANVKKLHIASFVTIAILYLTGICLITVTGLAPLGHYRYSIAVAGLAPVLAASCLGAIRDRGIQVLLAGLIALFALGQTPLGERIAIGMLQPQMRFEMWRQIAKQIDSDANDAEDLVIVFPNLIEDGRIVDRSQFPRSSYFWAPLCVFNRLSDKHTIVAKPSWSADRFDQAFILSLVEQGTAWLVIRGGPSSEASRPNELSESIMEELRSKLRLVNARIQFQNRGPASSDVQLIWSRITTGDTAQ